jgi:molybdopterin molybdotransferase
MAIEYRKARQLILERANTSGVENILIESALDRIIAEDFRAPINVPPFPRSPLDGFAMKASDTLIASAGKPVLLAISGSINCGENTPTILSKGNCVKISTGAPIPTGANAVIAKEETKRENGRIAIFQPLKPGDNLVVAGEDIKQDELVIRKGTKIKPAHIGMLASMGCAEISVFRRPLVAVISTGQELTTPGDTLPRGAIYDCNGPMIAALISSCQSIPLKKPTIADDTDLLAEALLESSAAASAVVTTGGVSVGDQDLIYQALKKIGAEILFWRLKMKPGTPMLTAVYKGKPIFCLSGNPGAAHVTFDLFVRPALLSMSGCHDWRRPNLEAALEHPLKSNNGQNRFIRATCSYSLADGQYSVKAAERERPGVLSASAEANALIYREAGAASLETGAKVFIEITDLPAVITGGSSLLVHSGEKEKRRHTKRFFPKLYPEEISS